MLKIKKHAVLIALILLIFMGGSLAAHAVSLRAAGDLGEPGFSLRYLESFGVVGEPYVFTNTRINHPVGLFVDASGALYVAERNGHRVMKFNASGDYEMSFGEVGQPWHHDEFLYLPKGVVVGPDDHVWAVMEHAIKEYAANGEFLQSFPADDQWETGDGNDRFVAPHQAIFSNDGSQLFVSDRYNHRIQIFSIIGIENTIAYVDTISGSFDQPHGIAFDKDGRLYVADYGNHQVLRCENTGTWSCSNFLGCPGSPGDALNELHFRTSVYVDSTDITADKIFVADGFNSRILRCNTDGDDCIKFADGPADNSDYQLTFLTGITGDSAGNIYVSDKDNHRVQVFDKDGNYVKTYGITRKPYLVDNVRMNKPVGVAIAPDGGIFVTEARGHRLIKLDANGNQVWTVGEAGVFGDDNEHFGAFWSGMQGNPAVGSNNRIYVADSPNNRIQVFNADSSFNVTYGEYGQANHQFDFPTYVTISPVNGDVYVSDTYNHRVQVFNANLVYKATLGVTGQSGDSSLHFNYPTGVAIDAGGAIYVGDYGNFRVQKCTLNASSYSCQTLIGKTGVYNGEFGQFVPNGLAVDADGRVYVSDDWASRIQVFDANGAFLTSVGGNWGANTSQFSTVGGIALDSSGNVYVVDADNHRIQKFSVGVQDWTQVNINGFGDPTNVGVTSQEIFMGQLYAGTGNWGGDGGQIWRSPDGTNWTITNTPGFGEENNSAITDMIEFNGQLYASTGWGGAAGQVWRSPDGEIWTQVVANGFDNPDNNAILRFVIFNDALYASTGNDVSGAEIWRTLSGNIGSWEKVLSDGNGNSNNYAVTTFVVFGDNLYTGAENTSEGAEVWRTSNGTNWSRVNVNGFGNPNNEHIGSIIEFNGRLYAGTQNRDSGAEIFRTSNGTTWNKVDDLGINDPANYKFESLYVYKNQMFVAANNDETGLKVWRSDDGVTFEQLIDDGFGDSTNTGTLWNSATIEFKGQLYIGTWNGNNGGELWRFGTGNFVYLPLILK